MDVQALIYSREAATRPEELALAATETLALAGKALAGPIASALGVRAAATPLTRGATITNLS